MAIGKVGSFATVEPALVDFGSMVERNIDKIKAEEAAKAQAKAKKEQADKDRLRDYKVPDKLGYTGIPEYDYNAQVAFKNIFKLANEAKLNGDEAGVMRYTGVLNQYIGRYEDVVKAIPGIQTAAEKDPTIDDDWVTDTLTTLTKLKENGHKLNVDDVDKPTISFKNEDGTFTDPQNWDEYLKTLTVPVRKIDLIDKTKKVLSTIKPSVTKDGSYAFNKEIKDINSEESKSQVDAIKDNVDMWVSNNDFMYSFYKMERSKNPKLPYKTTGWTEDEVGKAKDFYTKFLIDAYNEEVKAGFGRPRGSGSGGSDVILSAVVPYNYETSEQEQPKMNQFKASLPDLKGRQFQLTKGGSLPKVAGKSLALAYATPGDSPKFVFQLQDTDRFGFSGQGGTGGGSEAAYEDIAPGHPLYGKALSNTMAVFGVSTVKDLQTVLRGEELTEAQNRGL